MVRHLSAHGSATLTELAEAAGVHVNTARTHVAALEEAGVLRGTPGPATGPGRPAVDYRLAEGWALSSTDFLELAELLAAALARHGPDPAQLEAVGREWGRYMVGRPGVRDIAVELPDALARLGYHVGIDGRQVLMAGCPCPIVAQDQPELLCSLAHGVMDGVLAASGSELRVARHHNNPATRRCTAALARRR
jgi:predicted ArsR family transcriptional regulator